MNFQLIIKVLLFTILQLIPLYIWIRLLKKKQIKIDWRLICGYFIFGSWFGMFGELFLFKFIAFFFDTAIWEYRTMPIHKGITSSYGPIMWGLASVYICFHKNYQLSPTKTQNPIRLFVLESGFLLILETLFNLLAYLIFKEYFFYYFVPDLWHWTSLTNLPFWWVGYKLVVKYSQVMYRQEKLNLAIAIMMIIIAFAYQ